MAVLACHKAAGARHGIAPEGKHVLYAEEVKVYQQVLYVILAHASTDDVWHHLNAVFLPYGGTDAGGPGAAAHDVFLYQPVGTLHVFYLLAV